MKRLFRRRLNRKQRLARDLLLLALAGAVCLYLFPLPDLTPVAAYRTVERRYLTGPGEVLAVLPTEQAHTQYVAALDGGRLSFASVYRQGLAWKGSQLRRAPLEEDGPLTRLELSHFWDLDLLVYCTDPDIVRVECEYLVTWEQFGQVQSTGAATASGRRARGGGSGGGGGGGSAHAPTDRSASADQSGAQAVAEHLYRIQVAQPESDSSYTNYYLDRDIRLLAYDADGAVVWEDPVPESWGQYTMAGLG